MGYPVHAHLEKEEYEELWQEQVKPVFSSPRCGCSWRYVLSCLLSAPASGRLGGTSCSSRYLGLLLTCSSSAAFFQQKEPLGLSALFFCSTQCSRQLCLSKGEQATDPLPLFCILLLLCSPLLGRSYCSKYMQP